MNKHTITQLALKIMVVSYLLMATVLVQFVRAEVYVIQLHHISAQDARSIIEPHLNKDSKITDNSNKLFIQSSPQDYDVIQSLISEIDVKPDEYIVELKILNRKLDDWEMGVKTDADSSDLLNRKTRRYSNDASAQESYQLRLRSGTQGFIQTGASATKTQVTRQYDAFVPKTVQRTLKSGFLVSVTSQNTQSPSEARQPSPQVTISLSAQSQQSSDQQHSDITTINSNNLFTANLGDWTLVAANDGSATSDGTSSTIYKSPAARNSQKQWIYLRVISPLN